MKIIFCSSCLLAAALLLARSTIAQSTSGIEKLPVNIVTAVADTGKPMILYITGDGGWNKFSKNLSQALAAKGFPVVALNANDYFWKKKTAAQTTSDITNLTKHYQNLWKRKKFILIGYSFGADVMPFVFNLLPVGLSADVVNINLLSPSTHTDFEIHLFGMIGGNSTSGESVVAEINKIISKPLTLIFGQDENNFPLKQLKNKNFVNLTLEGGHHYDGNEDKLCNMILLQLPKIK